MRSTSVTCSPLIRGDSETTRMMNSTTIRRSANSTLKGRTRTKSKLTFFGSSGRRCAWAMGSNRLSRSNLFATIQSLVRRTLPTWPLERQLTLCHRRLLSNPTAKSRRNSAFSRIIRPRTQNADRPSINRSQARRFTTWFRLNSKCPKGFCTEASIAGNLNWEEMLSHFQKLTLAREMRLWMSCSVPCNPDPSPQVKPALERCRWRMTISCRRWRNSILRSTIEGPATTHNHSTLPRARRSSCSWSPRHPKFRQSSIDSMRSWFTQILKRRYP